MEIKKELENYNNYLAEIKTIEYKIKKLEKEEVAISGSNFEVNGDIKGKGYKSSNTENKIIKNVDKIELLKKKKEELKAKVNMIDGLINILNETEKKVIELWYKKSYKKTEIGKEIYISRSNVYDVEKRAIKKMEEYKKKTQTGHF